MSRLLATALVLAAGALACGRKPAPAKPAAAAEPPAPSYELRLGKKIYDHYCQICHGETAGGDGFNSFNLDPKPRDLSDPKFAQTKSEADLADAVRRGGSGVGLSPLMPPYGHTLSARQIDEVVLYLKSLQKKPEPQRAPDGSAAQRPSTSASR
jgi:mono/diheme cytochrome c family protein